MMRIGIVGLGKMGSTFAQRLATKGFSVTGWDRDTSKTVAGAPPAASLGDMIKGIDAIIVMLWGDDAAREVSLGEIIPAAQTTQLVIEMSTLSPQMYQTLADAARKRNVTFLAAPVLGSVDIAQKGALTVLAGGERDAFERAHDILNALGSTVLFTGDVRASGYLKLANNTVLGVFGETMHELLPFCEHGGVDRKVAIELLTGTFQRAASGKMQQLLDNDTAPRFSLDALLKDLELASGAARTLGVQAPILETILPRMRSAHASGLGDRDYIAIALQPERATKAM